MILYEVDRPFDLLVASNPFRVSSTMAASTVWRLSPAWRAIVRMLG
jgi:hypothetical protein